MALSDHGQYSGVVDIARNGIHEVIRLQTQAKQDDALIRKLVEALDLGHSFGIECCNSFAERMNGRRQDQLTQLLAEAEQILNAAKAGRARLEGKP